MSNDFKEDVPREEGSLGVYDPHTVRFIAAVCQNMPRLYRDTMLSWANSPKKLKKALKDALLPPWCTLTINSMDLADLLKQISYIGMSINGRALAESFPNTPIKKEIVEIEVVQVSDLGLPDGGRYAEVLAQLPEYDLQICREQIGLYLTPVLKKTIHVEYEGDRRIFHIGMLPLQDGNEFSGIFAIGSRLGYLDAIPCNDNRYWPPETTFVFERVR